MNFQREVEELRRKLQIMGEEHKREEEEEEKHARSRTARKDRPVRQEGEGELVNETLKHFTKISHSEKIRNS